jgi:hypothetical protein
MLSAGLPVRVSILKTALLVTVAGILIAGLWPFNFRPQNGVKVLPGVGLRIDRNGQILSTEPWHIKNQTSQFSVEFWFRPAGTGYAYDSAVLSLSSPGVANFAIGQSGRDLYAAVSIPNANRDAVLRKLWLDGACARDRPLLVTVVSSAEGVVVYLDGHATRSFPVSVAARTLSGTIILGHTPSGDQPWSGDLFGVALYDRKLSAGEVIHHIEQWRGGKTQELKEQEGAVGLYDLRTASTSLVRNLGPYGPDLVIPKTFHARSKHTLGWPATWNNSTVADALENIAGFMPMGFLFVLAVGGITRRSLARVSIAAISAAALLSLSIELLQVYLPSRDSSLADLLTNILGAALGSALAIALISRRKHLRAHEDSSHREQD